jgi:hypothetical protein
MENQKNRKEELENELDRIENAELLESKKQHYSRVF